MPLTKVYELRNSNFTRTLIYTSATVNFDVTVGVYPLSRCPTCDTDKFTGDLEEYQLWRFECLNIIDMKPTLNTDIKKIMYMGSRMEKEALKWYQMYMKERQRL